MVVSVGKEKVLLCSLNAKFIHSSLSLRYLQAYTLAKSGLRIDIKEFTINQATSDIMADIYQQHPKFLGFSCYIWNIKEILDICADYKKVAPETIIILGGPEVSYDAEQLLQDNPYVDYVVRGEGEVTFNALLLALQGDTPLENINGISYRYDGETYNNQDRELIADLDVIPFPYQNELDKLTDRIVYYEGSRGCPFRCSYCLSSTSKRVRSFSLERVKNDLALMLRYQVREIKFVDRTFNYDEKRVKEIISFIVEHRGTVKIHFEIDAKLFSDSMLEYLNDVPPDLFNFEIGVQSTFKPALDAVRRNLNWEKLSYNIKKLRSRKNIHLHLDLIAGLPEENFDNFTRSFNMVYDLQPDVLQLGFLKLLKGSDLLKESEQYGYVYQSKPPYQVLSNRYITYDQILILNRIEDILDRYYNSGDMRETIPYITSVIYGNNAIRFYDEYSHYWNINCLFEIGHKKEELYNYLQSFIKEKYPNHLDITNELLKFDYLCNNHRYGLPTGLYSYNPDKINDLIYSYTRDKNFVAEHLGSFAARTPREIKKLIHIEYFQVDPRTYQKVDHNLALMFIYDPIKKVVAKIVNLENHNTFISPTTRT